MSSNKIESILKRIKDKGFTAYDISQNTTLAFNTVDNIINGKSRKPFKTTINVIEDFLNSEEGIIDLEKEEGIYNLERKALEKWDLLMERPGFKAKVEGLVKDEIILRLEDIIKRS